MTKYILHGGKTGIDCEENNKFFKEIVADLADYSKVLLIYFARDEDTWENRLSEEEKKFNLAAGGKKILLTVATKNIPQLIEDIKDSDAIYICGGDTEKLIDAMKNVPDLKNLLQNKTVAGSSAGAYILSKYYYSKDLNQIGEGLGVLPIKSFCHYLTTDEKEIKELEDFKEKLELYKIPETKFMVLKV